MEHLHQLPENIDSAVRAASFEDVYPQRPNEWDVMGPEGIEYCSEKWNWEWLPIPEVEMGTLPADGPELFNVPSREAPDIVDDTSIHRETNAASIETGDTHPRPRTQDEEFSSGNEGLLPFPRDRDQLVEYLARGLSLARLFPATGRNVEKNIVCKGQLELAGDQWMVMENECNKPQGTSTNLQRHVKRDHLHVPGDSSTIKELVAGWKIYPDIKVKNYDRKLWIMPWDSLRQPFPATPQPVRKQTTPVPTPGLPSSTSPERKKRIGTKAREMETGSREGKGHAKRTGRA